MTLSNSYGAVFNAAVTTATSVVLDDTAANQIIRFADDLSTLTLSTATKGYHLELLGSHTQVTSTSPTTFYNTGHLILGNGAADTLSFTGGLVAAAEALTGAFAGLAAAFGATRTAVFEGALAAGRAAARGAAARAGSFAVARAGDLAGGLTAAFAPALAVTLAPALALPDLFTRDPKQAAQLSTARAKAEAALQKAEEDWLQASAAHEEAQG